jgi:hypothetical protein
MYKLGTVVNPEVGIDISSRIGLYDAGDVGAADGLEAAHAKLRAAVAHFRKQVLLFTSGCSLFPIG